MAEARAETMQQERGEVCAALQYAASFHCQVEEWKDCDELKPKPKDKLIFCGPEKRGNEASNGVVSSRGKVSMHESKRQQVHEDARKMHRAKILVNKFGKMEKASSGRS